MLKHVPDLSKHVPDLSLIKAQTCVRCLCQASDSLEEMVLLRLRITDASLHLSLSGIGNINALQ